MAQHLTGTVTGFMYLGQFISDTCSVYNISGYGVSTQVFPYDTTNSKSIYESGINITITSGVDIIPIDVSIPVNCTVNLLTGQTSDFTYTVYYENPGNNLITVNNTLYYNNSDIQPDPFYVYKNCAQFWGLVLEDLIYDDNYINSFGMDGVAYIGLENNTDYSSLVVYPNVHNKTNINKIGLVDRTRGYYFLDNNYSINETNIYENGVALQGSGYITSGSEYILSGDYGLNNTYAILEDTPNGDAQATYDIISGRRNYFQIPEDYIQRSGNYYLPSLEPFDQNIYLNGVKLETGITYFGERIDNSDLIRIDSGLYLATGKVFSFPVETGIIKYTGYFDSKLTTRFAKGTSMLWANGIRQFLNNEYLEIPKFSLLTGDRVKNLNIDLIFNDSNDFWE